MFHVHLLCLNILTEILHTSLLSQFKVTSHMFCLSLKVDFEIYIMYELNTRNCCLCQINCRCRYSVYLRAIMALGILPSLCLTVRPERFSCWEIKTSYQESYSRNQSSNNIVIKHWKVRLLILQKYINIGRSNIRKKYNLIIITVIYFIGF